MPDGTVWAKDLKLTTTTAAFNEVQWFEGAAARKQCKKDGEAETGEWCSEYYWKDGNPRVRTAPVAAKARFELASYRVKDDGDATPVAVSRSQFEKAFTADDGPELVQVTVSGGQVVVLAEQYTP